MLQILDALVNIVVFRDIEITIPNRIAKLVLFAFVKSKSLPSNKKLRPIIGVKSLGFRQVDETKLVKIRMHIAH